MNRHFLTATLASVATLLSAAPAVVSAQAFEGVITMRMGALRAGGDGLQEIEYLSHGGKVRMNIKSQMGPIGIIGDPAEKKLYVLIDPQSMYMEISTDAAAGRAGAGAGAVNVNIAEPKITRTGKKETIAGRECEHITVEAQQETTDVCVARGLGPFMNAMSSMGGMGGMMGMGGRGATAPPAWQRSLAADGAFPLKATRADGTVLLEVTKIEPKKLANTLFTVPGNYAKMDMPRRP